MFHHDAVERLGAAVASAIYEETLKQIDRMVVETPAAIRRTGTLRIAASRDELSDCALQYEAMRSAGLPVDLYDGPEGAGCSFPPTRHSIPARAARRWPRMRSPRRSTVRSFAGRFHR